MKKIITIFLLLSISIFSQDKKKSSKKESPKEVKKSEANPEAEKRKGIFLTSEEDRQEWMNSNRVALIVGVNNYSSLSKLTFAVSDSKKMELTLSQIGKFKKIILLNDDEPSERKPTRANIDRYLKELTGEHPAMLLFYFSGHGFMNKEGENVIAPIDIDYVNKEKISNYINIPEVVKLVKKNVKQGIFLLDACREQLTADTKSLQGEVFNDFPDEVTHAEGIGIMMGTMPGGFSYENPTLGGGTFTHFIVEGMSGAIQNEGMDYVTFGKLKEYVEKNMKEYTKKKTGKEQIPYVGGDYTGNFLLAVGHPKSEIQSKLVKYVDRIHQLRYSRILVDTLGRRIQQNFFLLGAGNNYSPSELDGIPRLLYDYGDEYFSVKQYNNKGEVQDEYGYNIKNQFPEVIINDNNNYMKIVYSRESNFVDEKYFDKSDKPIADSSQVAKIKYEHSNGLISKISYYDLDGKLKLSKNGYAMIKYAYDLNGFKVQEEYYDSDEKLKNDKSGIAKITYEYDRSGNRILEKYYSESDKLADKKIAIRKFIFENGRKVEESYHDSSENFKNDASGTAKIIYEYDRAGNKTSEKYYSKEKELKKTGIAIKKYEYDSSGNKLSEGYYSYKENELYEDRYFGIAKYEYKYNSKGKKEEERYYNSRGKPAPDTFGIYSRSFIYNSRGELIEESYRGKEDEAISDKSGISKKVFTYDEKGNLVAEEYITINGDRAEDVTGVFKKNYTYNAMGKKILEEYYNRNDSLKENSNKVAKYIFIYDENGNEIGKELFNADNNLFQAEYFSFLPNFITGKKDSKIRISYDKYYRPTGLKILD